MNRLATLFFKRIPAWILFLSLVTAQPLTPEAPALAALKLSQTSITIQEGKVGIVRVKKNTYPTLQVASSDPRTVAAALTGKQLRLIAISPGTATVRVDALNKKNKLKKFREIEVTVDAKPEVDTAFEYAPTQIHTGEGTFYDRGETTGAANLDDFEETYLTAAMNSEDYLNGLAGAYIEITDKDGDQVNVLITDMLPAGQKGDIDLSRKAFKQIEPTETGRMAISWRVIALPTADPVRFLWKPTSSKYWAQVQVRNNTYPVAGLEVLDEKTGNYIPLIRESYNYFTAPDGLGDGDCFTFRITDIYGRQITETDVPLKTNGKEVPGTTNFPALDV